MLVKCALKWTGPLKWTEHKIPKTGPLKWAGHLSGRKHVLKSIKIWQHFAKNLMFFSIFRACGAFFAYTGPLKWTKTTFQNSLLVHLSGRALYQLSAITLKWTDRKFDRYISIIPGNVQKSDYFDFIWIWSLPAHRNRFYYEVRINLSWFAPKHTF